MTGVPQGQRRVLGGAHHPEGDTDLPPQRPSPCLGAQTYLSHSQAGRGPFVALGSFCPQEAAEPWQCVLEWTKAVSLPYPIWAAAARSVSCRVGQRQAGTREEVGGGFFLRELQ